MMDDFLIVLGSTAFLILVILFTPFVLFWICYFIGWIAVFTIGDVLAFGLNTLFQTTYFTKDMIPLIAGTIGWVGSCFSRMNAVTYCFQKANTQSKEKNK